MTYIKTQVKIWLEQNNLLQLTLGWSQNQLIGWFFMTGIQLNRLVFFPFLWNSLPPGGGRVTLTKIFHIKFGMNETLI